MIGFILGLTIGGCIGVILMAVIIGGSKDE